MNTIGTSNVTRRSITCVALTAGLCLGSMALQPASASTPPESGCPAGHQTLSVAQLFALGYLGVPRVDDPANGGNGDGWVCGRSLNDTQSEKACGGPCGVPVLYTFRDNMLTPEH